MPQFWIGSTDVNFMLTEIGGWHVGCHNDVGAHEAVKYAIAKGWVGERTHYAEVWPDGTRAYELTDAGLDRVAKVYGLKGFQAADKMRQWYRDRAPDTRPSEMP